MELDLIDQKISDILDLQGNNCICCMNFKICKNNSEYGRCKNNRINYALKDSVKISNVVSRIIKFYKDGTVYSRVNCSHFEGDIMS